MAAAVEEGVNNNMDTSGLPLCVTSLFRIAEMLEMLDGNEFKEIVL